MGTKKRFNRGYFAALDFSLAKLGRGFSLLKSALIK